MTAGVRTPPGAPVTPVTDEEKGVASRSNIYRALAMSFDFFDRDFFEYLNSGGLFGALSALTGLLPYRIEAPPDLRSSHYASFDDFSADYIRIFDAAPGGPPCPLYEGFYAQDRQVVMGDLMRFYDYFDLKLNPQQKEMPDHIAVEMEFMHYLTFREAGALQRGKDVSPYRRAQRDFFERHLLKWIPKVTAKLQALPPPAYFGSFFGFLNALLDADHAYVTSLITD